LRGRWAAAADAPWKLAALLVAVLTLWRGVVLFGPAQGAGPWMAAQFVVMAATPFVFLSCAGRDAIGLRPSSRPLWFIWGPLLGVFAAVVIGLTGILLFDWSPDNWYVSVGQTMVRDPRLAELPPAGLFIALAVPAAVFSPIGEELFFRGLLHTTIEEAAGRTTAAASTAISFGLIHVLHHGIAVTADGWRAFPLSGSIWFALVVGLSLSFTVCRIRSGSIWPAVAAHSAFNIAMVIFIVFLWPP
jgi:hypothetical protein